MSNKYEAVDAEIISCIRSGRRTFSEMGTAKATAEPMGEGWRIVDRRLQSLRKRGLIEYVSGSWREVESA
jgi:hypothetical protein